MGAHDASFTAQRVAPYHRKAFVFRTLMRGWFLLQRNTEVGPPPVGPYVHGKNTTGLLQFVLLTFAPGCKKSLAYSASTASTNVSSSSFNSSSTSRGGFLYRYTMSITRCPRATCSYRKRRAAWGWGGVLAGVYLPRRVEQYTLVMFCPSCRLRGRTLRNEVVYLVLGCHFLKREPEGSKEHA